MTKAVQLKPITPPQRKPTKQEILRAVKREAKTQMWNAKRWQAMILYVRDGLTIKPICDKLQVSQPIITKWIKAGKWNDLISDRSVLIEYKAANLFINEGLTTGEISQRLSVPEAKVRYWIDANGWNAARLADNAKADLRMAIDDYSDYVVKTFPKIANEIELSKDWYYQKLMLNQ